MTTESPPRRVRVPQLERVETTRRKILDSALLLLREGGFKAATLQAVARGADVSLGALQHHFESRDALMERLVEEVMAPLAGDVWPDVALPVRERAGRFVDRAWLHIFGESKYLAAWSLFFGCKSAPSLFDRIDDNRGAADQVFFTRFLESFPEVSEHHPYPRGLAGMVFAALRGLGVLELFQVEEGERNEELQALVETIVHACGGELAA